MITQLKWNKLLPLFKANKQTKHPKTQIQHFPHFGGYYPSYSYEATCFTTKFLL